jgi:hypothetical protein
VSDTATRSRRALNDRNLLLVVVGAALVIAALGGLQWYTTEGGNNVAGLGFTATDLQANADSLGAPVAGAYFDWLGMTLLVVGGVAALAANVPSPVCDPLRVVAFLAGLLGVIATYYALAQLFNAQKVAGGSAHAVLHNASFGVWAALAGFALITVGGALGPRRRPA